MDWFARTCNYNRMNVTRLFARGFVIVGGLAWIAVALGFGAKTYLASTPLQTTGAVLIPLVIAVGAFLIGWFYERLAGLLLLIGAAVVVVWGLIAGWELGVWATMATFLIAEMVIAGLLYLFAGQTQQVCELEEKAKA